VSAGWDCEAYGPGPAAEIGAVCFVAGELGKRVCGDLAECQQVMTAERQRVFRRISERAAAGDETAAFLAGEFTNPEQLLGGGQEPGQ
jgi:hypothetical protein